MNDTPHQLPHIGYADLDELLRTADSPVVYAMPVETTRPAAHGLSRHELTIVVSQVRADGVHHCKIRYAELLYMAGRPMDEDKAERARSRFDAAWEAVKTYLAEENFDVRQAAVARPSDLVLVNGWAKILDEKTGEPKGATP